MERPTYIDISANSSRAPSSAGTARTGQPSPRIQHFDGDVPPILSPLDAIAAESRRLAKELEATRLAGERRMSRLPPAIISKSLSQHQANRPACFRSLSTYSTDPVPSLPNRDEPFTSTANVEVNEPRQRPKSSYPRISEVPQEDEDEEDDETHNNGFFETPREFAPARNAEDYFEIRRTASPPTLAEDHTELSTSRADAGRPDSVDVLGLIPPSAPFAKNKSYHESSDDDYTSSNAGSTFSRPRKLSNSSGMSYQVSPALHAQHERSPSTKSDVSTGSLSRSKQMNFSRPMSQASGNLKVDSPSKTSFNLERKPSHLSEETRNLTSFEDDRSVLSDGILTGQGSSYTHKKFVLPRGKMSEKAAQRVSQLFAGLSGPTFGWQEPVFPGTPPLSARTINDSFFPLASPGLRPSLDPGRPSFDPGSSTTPLNSPPLQGFAFGFENSNSMDRELDRPSSSHTNPEVKAPAAPVMQRPSTAHNGSSFDRMKMPTLPTIPGSTVDDMSVKSTYTRTERSASTVRPTTARSQSDYQALSADEHVDKAIQLHQHGDLKESTYHLRIAAKQDHPVGMLLYALACRHGWGMRANPAEAVMLLRKAVDIAMHEVTEDENASSPRPKPNAIEKKSHEAQFALAIYELGMSHLKGWGVEVDKPLALRCFEIAGSWGDADALTEAGFCYSTGTGCKKDLKKAAKFYRAAAEKGVSMVGNSWIYKEKYNDTNDTKDLRSRKMSAINEVKEKKPRDKSRTRSIFGRKRATTVSADKD